MNKRVILILGLFVSIGAVLWFGQLLGSRKHDTSDSPSIFRIAPFDERSKAFVLERETKWFRQHDYSALSGLMRATGLVPSMRSLTNLLTSPTPEYLRWKLYWWLRPRQATGANGLATMKGGYFEVATLDNNNANPTLRVSDDGHVGLLWMAQMQYWYFRMGPTDCKRLNIARKQVPIVQSGRECRFNS